MIEFYIIKWKYINVIKHIATWDSMQWAWCEKSQLSGEGTYTKTCQWKKIGRKAKKRLKYHQMNRIDYWVTEETCSAHRHPSWRTSLWVRGRFVMQLASAAIAVLSRKSAIVTQLAAVLFVYNATSLNASARKNAFCRLMRWLCWCTRHFSG